jgi:hypothetical protein
VRTEQWKGEDGGQRSDLAIEAEALGHDLAFGVATFQRRHRMVSAQTLTPDGVVDLTTGELTPVASEVPPLPPGLEDPVGDPGGRPTESGEDEELDDLDEGGAGDGSQREVSLLASA